ncbi:hypothetical protein FRC08_015396 [Ceratobasidium sp. 394]|nr:hypothetical protein FRC08_015396 [Ceratobasidium sp. 394]
MILLDTARTLHVVVAHTFVAAASHLARADDIAALYLLCLFLSHISPTGTTGVTLTTNRAGLLIHPPCAAVAVTTRSALSTARSSSHARG